MKKNNYLVLYLLLISTITFAQNFSIVEPIEGKLITDSKNIPCLLETQRAEIKATLASNIEQLKQQGKLTPKNKKGGHPLFIWPVKQAANSNYESVWGLRDYVDHNPASPNMITDYNCGDRSFDNEEEGYNHQGTDIRIWPFYWDMMDNNKVEVIAAAEGQIIDKVDGNFDRNCDYSPNPWNAVYIQHNDGSSAWYGNLKNGSLTTKEIGDTVEQGEFLGIVGSSGVSPSPHLHFEVYDSENNLIDPYYGDCNAMNSDSWWQDQKPYYNTSINAIATHSYSPTLGECWNDTQDILNLQNDFYEGDTIYWYIYLKDQKPGDIIHIKNLDSDGNIASEWEFVAEDYLSISYWGWYYGPLIDEAIGTYTFEASYGDQTVSHQFNYHGALGMEDAKLDQTSVFPNPLKNTLFIESEATIVSADIRDVLGRTVYSSMENTSSIREIDVSTLTKGIYFITLVSDENQSKTIKLIKD